MASLDRHCGVNESIISEIKKCAENIRGREFSGFALQAKVIPVNDSSA